jgi:hypothetical protein
MKLLYAVIDGHKECTKCHIIKPVCDYQIRNNKNGSSTPEANCRKCKAEYINNLRRSRGVQVRKRYPIIDDHKECTACNINKHVSEYYMKADGKIFAKCSLCMIEYHEKNRRVIGMKKNYKFPIIDGIKKCSKCFIDKPVIEYLKGMHHCKKCYIEPIIKRRKEVYNEYDKIRSRVYYNNNKEKVSNRYRTHWNKTKENVGDSYIKALLTGNTTIKRADIPPELIEIKRKQVLLSRQIKK